VGAAFFPQVVLNASLAAATAKSISFTEANIGPLAKDYHETNSLTTSHVRDDIYTRSGQKWAANSICAMHLQYRDCRLYRLFNKYTTVSPRDITYGKSCSAPSELGTKRPLMYKPVGTTSLVPVGRVKLVERDFADIVE